MLGTVLETVLALAAAALYGSADFLGGTASRRASTFAVLAVTVPAGAAVMLVAMLLLGGLSGGELGWAGMTSAGAGWAAAAGTCGALGLIAFYAGFAAAPMSVVAPVAALVSTVLPVGAALANVCYVLATRAGLFGLAVVLTSLYPGVTVLLARIVLGERMRWVQRAGLLLAAAGIILVTG